MATIRFDAQSSGLQDARQNLLRVRQQIQNINVSLERNATEYRRASESQRQNLRIGREELQLARRRASNSAAQVRLYIAEQNELARLVREKERANRASRQFQQTIRGLGQDLRFFLVGAATQSIQNFIFDMTQITAETETARATLRKFSTDVDGTFAELEREARSLIGIDVTGFIRSFTGFRAAGADAEDATTLVRGFTRGLAELGVVGDETNRFFVQLRQSFAANQIEGDDVKTLFEIFPSLMQTINAELGTNIQSWKDLKPSIEAAGLSVREFYAQIGRRLDLTSAGADVDTYRAQVELLREEYEALARSIGGVVVPALTSIVQTLTGGDITGQINRINQVITRGGGIAGDREQESVEARRVQIRTRLRDVEREIGNATAIQGRRGETFDQLRLRLSRELNEALEARRQLLEEVPAGVGTQELLTIQRTQLNNIERQSEELQRLNELNTRRRDLLNQIAAFEREITTEQRNRGGLRPERAAPDPGITRPRSEFLPQTRPETSSVDRQLSEIGPQITIPIVRALGELQDEYLQGLRRILVEEDGVLRSGFRPDIPSISPQDQQPLPDLSGGLSDLRQIFETIRVNAQDIANRTEASFRVATIPVFDFARGLRELGTVLQGASRDADDFNTSIEQSRRRFAREAEAELNRSISNEQSLQGRLLSPIIGVQGVGFSNVGIGSEQRRESIDEQRLFAIRTRESLEDVERDTQRRIADIRDQAEISEQERLRRIEQVQLESARRREDIEISQARRLEELDRQYNTARTDQYIEYADSIITQINRILIEEINAAIVKDLIASLPTGAFGFGTLVLAGFGTSLLATALAAARRNRAQSAAEEEIRRLRSTERASVVVQTQVRYDDGSIRRQNTNGQRIDNEGRTPR